MFGSARGLARLARSGSALSDRGRGTAAPADASGVLLPPRRRSLLGEGDASTPLPTTLQRAASFASGSPSSSSSADTWRKHDNPDCFSASMSCGSTPNHTDENVFSLDLHGIAQKTNQ